MRNNAPIKHFPPTPFSPNRSPIYGEAHFFAARFEAGNSSAASPKNAATPTQEAVQDLRVDGVLAEQLLRSQVAES